MPGTTVSRSPASQSASPVRSRIPSPQVSSQPSAKAASQVAPQHPPQADPPARPPLRSFPDRVRQIALFELGGLLLITPVFAYASGMPAGESVGLLAVLALIAAVWNGAYNSGFDLIEGRLTGRRADRRPFALRCAHACGFEGGLLLLTLPVIVAWTGMGWLAALIADVGLAIAYTLYALLFNLGYDRLFPIACASSRRA